MRYNSLRISATGLRFFWNLTIIFSFLLFISTFYFPVVHGQRINLPSNTITRAPASAAGLETIPLGFRAAVDSTGLYIILYRLSRSSLDGPHDFIVETMLFRASAFNNGRVPTLTQRVPLEHCDVTIRYTRPQTATNTAVVNLLSSSSGASSASLLASISTATQFTRSMRPTSATTFALTNLLIPPGVVDVQLTFAARLVPSASELAAYRDAVAAGALPAADNPYGTLELSVRAGSATSDDGTLTRSGTVTVVTLLVGSYQWATVRLSTATERSVDLPLPSSANGPDEGIVDVSVVAGMRSNPDADPNIGGGRSLWGDMDADGVADVGGSSIAGQGHDHVLFKQSNPMVPSYFAPQHMLPLTDTGAAEGSGHSVFTHPVAAVAVATHKDFNSTADSGSALPYVSPPVQVKLLPHGHSTSSFPLPSLTIGLWPSSQLEVLWADVQMQLQLYVARRNSDKSGMNVDVFGHLPDVRKRMHTMRHRADTTGMHDGDTGDVTRDVARVRARADAHAATPHLVQLLLEAHNFLSGSNGGDVDQHGEDEAATPRRSSHISGYGDEDHAPAYTTLAARGSNPASHSHASSAAAAVRGAAATPSVERRSTVGLDWQSVRLLVENNEVFHHYHSEAALQAPSVVVADSTPLRARIDANIGVGVGVAIESSPGSPHTTTQYGDNADKDRVNNSQTGVTDTAGAEQPTREGTAEGAADHGMPDYLYDLARSIADLLEEHRMRHTQPTTTPTPALNEQDWGRVEHDFPDFVLLSRGRRVAAPEPTASQLRHEGVYTPHAHAHAATIAASGRARHLSTATHQGVTQRLPENTRWENSIFFEFSEEEASPCDAFASTLQDGSLTGAHSRASQVIANTIEAQRTRLAHTLEATQAHTHSDIATSTSRAEIENQITQAVTPAAAVASVPDAAREVANDTVRLPSPSRLVRTLAQHDGMQTPRTVVNVTGSMGLLQLVRPAAPRAPDSADGHTPAYDANAPHAPWATTSSAPLDDLSTSHTVSPLKLVQVVPNLYQTDLSFTSTTVPVPLAARTPPASDFGRVGASNAVVRYEMSPYPAALRANATYTPPFFHLDANLYALRINTSAIDLRAFDVFVMVHYQFTFQERRTNSIMRTTWNTYITRLPPHEDTLPSNAFPSAALPPALLPSVLSPGAAITVTRNGTRRGGVETLLPILSAPRPELPARAPANSNSMASPTNAAAPTSNAARNPTATTPRDEPPTTTNTTAAADTGANAGAAAGPSTFAAETAAAALHNIGNPSSVATPENRTPTAASPDTVAGAAPDRRRGRVDPSDDPYFDDVDEEEDDDAYFEDLYGYPVSPLYPGVGWNITWFLVQYAPSSPYLFRHDVTPASLRQAYLVDSAVFPFLNNTSVDPLANSYFVVDLIPSIAVRFICEVLDAKINVHVNDKYQGTYNMKYIEGDVYEWEELYNDLDGDGERDSPALHNTDPQAYVRPFEGERWMSPVIQVHPNDLLTFSFTYQLRPYEKYIPKWADPDDEAFLEQTATTTLYAFEGARAYVHAILPVEAATADPAEIRTSPRFKYSVKLRTAIASSKVAMHFVIGRISAHDGGLLGLPPIEAGVCHATSQGLPLRSRHNVWMRLEFMPVSISPVAAAAATGDSEGSLSSGFANTMPASLRGPFNFAGPVGGGGVTSMTAIINYVVSTLPPLLEEWWYFDGLLETTSSLHTEDDLHATFTSSTTDTAPFPDRDPGLQLKATPDEELLLYAFTWWPEHNEQDVMTTGALIYSPDTFTTTGRAMGYAQSAPLLAVCF